MWSKVSSTPKSAPPRTGIPLTRERPSYDHISRRQNCASSGSVVSGLPAVRTPPSARSRSGWAARWWPNPMSAVTTQARRRSSPEVIVPLSGGLSRGDVRVARDRPPDAVLEPPDVREAAPRDRAVRGIGHGVPAHDDRDIAVTGHRFDFDLVRRVPDAPGLEQVEH